MNGIGTTGVLPNNALGVVRQAHAMRAGRYAGGGLATKARDVAGAGRYGDTMLAHVSPEEVATLRGIGGSVTYNPETGLPEFFSIGKFLKKIARVAAPIAGFVIGNTIAPGIGGYLGAGLGSLATSKLMGDSWKDAALQGAISGLGSYGLASAFPQTAGAMNLNSLLGSGTAAGIGGAGAAGTVATGAPVSLLPAGAVTSAGAAGTAGTAAGAAGAGAAAAPAAEGLVSSLTPSWGTLATLGAGAALGAGASGTEQAQQVAAAPGEPDLGVVNYLPLNREGTPFSGDLLGYGYGPEHKYFDVVNPPPVNAAHGGSMRGPGGGQDDRIPAMLSDGEYVVPADVVSNLGDGSNTRGAEKLDGLSRGVRRRKGGATRLPPKTRGIGSYLHAA